MLRKTHNRILISIFLCLFLFFTTTPVKSKAAESSNKSYMISLHLVSVSGETVFLLNAQESGEYAVAEYDSKANVYCIISYTTDLQAATRFSCSMDSTNPQTLRISGLKPNMYLLRCSEIPDGYLPPDDITISVTTTGITVDSVAVKTYSDSHSGETIIPLDITLAKSSKMPLSQSSWVCWSIRIFGFNVFPLICCILLCGSSIALFILIKRRTGTYKQS